MSTLSAIVSASYATSKEADGISKELKRCLGYEHYYEIARLAIGRSLGLSAPPPAAPDSKGQVLRGLQLFGQDNNTSYAWIALLGEQSRQYGEKEFSIEALQRLVRDHWHRGTLLLQTDWRSSGEDFAAFLELLARKAELPETHTSDNALTIHTPGEDDRELLPSPVNICVGEDVGQGVPFEWRVNGVGYAPHMAIMGQAGSGKTRTMLEILKQIRAQSAAPVLLLDLGKGDLAENGDLADALDAQVLRVPEMAIPLDMLHGSDVSEEDASDAVMGFRDSFERVMQSKPGAKQLDTMRSALKPLFAKNRQITLGMVGDALRDYYCENELKTDSVISTINDLTERLIFEPKLSPAEFFSRSWIITFANARDTIKNLATFLLECLPETPNGSPNRWRW